MPELAILDVGHGNCAVIFDGTRAVVVDAGPGTALLEFLTEREISHVVEVLISHADADHLKGLLALLDQDDIRVERVRLNSDATKHTAQWRALVFALEERHRTGQCDFRVELKEGMSISFGDDCRLSVLAPRAALAAMGPGSADDQGREITTNTMSAVLKATLHDRSVLLTGDVDEVGLAHLLESGQDLKADILVFPHHGGNVRLGAKPERNRDFAELLLQAVEPETVVFSIGRSKHRNPRPEIVDAVCSAPRRNVMCTQMSRSCAADDGYDDAHLSEAFAAGKRRGHCCAGSIVVSPEGLVPSVAAHAAFVRVAAPTALCARSVSAPLGRPGEATA